jgi:ferric-dicitrate binding protein FerR (iron transport regulator)
MTRWRRTTACERAAQWISLDLDGELGRLEQAALARHLGRCDRCRAARTEYLGFTSLIREASPVEPQRLVTIPPSPRAVRRTTLRGLAVSVALAAVVFGAFKAVPHSSGHPVSSLSFDSRAQQRAYAREHVRIEPTFFNATPAPTATPFAGRVLL